MVYFWFKKCVFILVLLCLQLCWLRAVQFNARSACDASMFTSCINIYTSLDSLSSCSKIFRSSCLDCRHRIENKQKGHSSQNLWRLCPHACRITHVHYAGSGKVSDYCISASKKGLNISALIVVNSSKKGFKGYFCIDIKHNWFWSVNCFFWPIEMLNWLFRHYSVMQIVNCFLSVKRSVFPNSLCTVVW